MKNIIKSMSALFVASVLTALVGCDDHGSAMTSTPTPVPSVAPLPGEAGGVGVPPTPAPAPGVEEDRGPASTPPATGLNPTNTLPSPTASPTVTPSI